MSSERRRDTRFEINQIVEMSFGRETFLHATGLNVSKTGMLCETDSYLEPYTQVSFMMSLPIGSVTVRISCEGIVVRSDIESDRYLAGISFTSMSDEDAQTLDKFLKSQKSTK